MGSMSQDERNAQVEQGARVPPTPPAAWAHGASRPGARVDRRVRRSRRAIMEAFDRLIADRPLGEITVSALAREADVDRKTVYQHFGSIDGLLDAIAVGVVTELLDEVELAMAMGGGAEGEGPRALQAFFATLAERMARDEALRRRYCEHVPSELLLERLAHPLAEQVAERGLAGGSCSDEDLEALLAFGLGGLLSLYRWWLRSDRTLSVEELTRRACLLLEHGVTPCLGGGA